MMSNYTVAAITYVLIAAFLIAGLLIGGLLVLSLGLMSKRDEDRIGGRTPSDVGILKNTNWPAIPENRHHLPAEEDEPVGEPDVYGTGDERRDRTAA